MMELVGSEHTVGTKKNNERSEKFFKTNVFVWRGKCMTYEDKSRDVLETNFVEVSLAPLRIIYFSEIPHAFEYI